MNRRHSRQGSAAVAGTSTTDTQAGSPIRFIVALTLLAACPAAGAERLTPVPAASPHINGPTIYGCRPKHPFLYRIPCTGQRPMRFTARHLPAGLTLDGETGIITGSSPGNPGEYAVTLEARNAQGVSKRKLRLRVGDTLALTPPMGWNHWYTHYSHISDQLFRAAADAMVSSGMADFGYQYVNIDDCWMTRADSNLAELQGPARDAAGAIVPNKNFPDMKALTRYIHDQGLKAGIYTSPGPQTCARYEGSYQHEEIDARKFAEWGFDFLKYDWCSYGKIVPKPSLDDRKAPYAKMGGILKSLDRDVVFNLCQYGAGNVRG